MSEAVQLGPYTLVPGTRWISVQRRTEDRPLEVSPRFGFHLTIEGRGPEPFRIHRLLMDKAGSALLHGSVRDEYALDVVISHVKEIESLDFRAQVANSGQPVNVRFDIQLLLPREADPRWLVPGFFYATNKPAGSTRHYPSYSHLNRDIQKLIASKWHFRSDRASTPLVAAWTYNCMAFLATDGIFGRTKLQPRGLGTSGLAFGSEDGDPQLLLEFPFTERPAKFSFCHDDRTAPQETFVPLTGKNALSASFQMGIHEPDLHGYVPVMRYLYENSGEASAPPNRLSSDHAEHLAHVGLLRWHYDARVTAIFETACFDRHFGTRFGYLERPHMHAGWLSGCLPAFTLLWAGRETGHEDSVQAGAAILSKFAESLAPCGTIFPTWTEEHGWSCSFGPEEGTAHSRTVAEGVLFLLRGLVLEMRHGQNRSSWSDAAISSLNYAMGSQREDGAFPSYFDLTTGRPAGFEGTAGIAWIAALATGSQFLDRAYYRDVAAKAGEYYATFIRNGFLYGSVEDQPSTPTSDDCQWALMAYLALYELDRDPVWLDLAKKSADLALTWRFTYNVQFAPASLPGRYHFGTRGGDISSVACPVTTCNGLLIYRELLKLAHYVGDSYYLRRAEDSRNFASQLVISEEGQYNGRVGMVAGQIFHSDWWQPKGVILSLSQAMAAALVKHTELLRRSLDDVLNQNVEAPEEFVEEKVLYSQLAFGEGADDQEADLPSGIMEVLGRIHDSDAAFGDEDKDAPQQKESRQAIPGVTQRDRGSRGLSTDQVPLPSLSPQHPVPYPDLQKRRERDQPTPQKSPEPRNDTSDDVEIKYKIF